MDRLEYIIQDLKGQLNRNKDTGINSILSQLGAWASKALEVEEYTNEGRMYPTADTRDLSQKEYKEVVKLIALLVERVTSSVNDEDMDSELLSALISIGNVDRARQSDDIESECDAWQLAENNCVNGHLSAIDSKVRHDKVRKLMDSSVQGMAYESQGD